MCKLRIIPSDSKYNVYNVYVDGQKITKKPIAFSEFSKRLGDFRLDQSKNVLIEKFNSEGEVTELG